MVRAAVWKLVSLVRRLMTEFSEEAYELARAVYTLFVDK